MHHIFQSYFPLSLQNISANRFNNFLGSFKGCRRTVATLNNKLEKHESMIK